MNESCANLLISKGYIIDNDVNFELTAYDQGKQSVNSSIEIDRFQCHFPSGVITEPNVLFLIYPSSVEMEPEVILSNQFLRDRFQFDIVERIADHIETTVGFDADYYDENDLTKVAIPFNQLTMPTQAELATFQFPDDSDPIESDPGINTTLQQDVDLCNRLQSMKLATSNRTNTVTQRSVPSPACQEWSSLKQQLVTALSDKDDISIVVKENVLSMATPQAQYTFSCHVDVGPELVSSGTTSSKSDEFARSLDDSILSATGTLPTPALAPVRDDDSFIGDTVTRIMLKRRKYAEIHSAYLNQPVLDSPPQVTDVSNQHPYKLAVDVTPNQYGSLSHVDPKDINWRPLFPATNIKPLEADLSHLDPYDKTWRFGAVNRIIPHQQPPPIDITNLFTEDQMASYVRRLKIRKIRLYACAARNNKSRKVLTNEVNNVLVDGNTLTALVRNNMDKFQINEMDIEEMDNTVKSNPKAFWFGQPETPEETQEYIQERVDMAAENLKDDPAITSTQIDELRSLVQSFPHNLRTRLGNDMVAKIPPMRITLRITGR